MKITGIYCIKNIKSGKLYIGSAANVERRWGEHRHMLRENKHHSLHLQSTWNKYGEESFVFLIVEECEPIKKILLEREQVQLDAVRIRNPDGTLGEIDHNLAYNICPIAGSNLGRKFSEEFRRKLSEINGGEKHPNFGKHLSEETKKRIGAALIGKHLSEEHKKKLSEAKSGEKNSFYGKHHSEETKKNMSEALSGEKHPNFGKHPSEEARKNMSEARSGEKNHKAKLTWEDVREIRGWYSTGEVTQKQLAVTYGISPLTVGQVVNNKTWKEVVSCTNSEIN